MTVALTSALLTRHEFSHGFSLRTGGVSESPFDALNLARTVGDDPKAVAENYARFTAALGVEPAMLYEVSQVHGDSVRLIEKGESVTAVRNTDADALIAGPGQGAVAVRTADCVPILLADIAGRHVAAVHAGWRGTVRGIVAATVKALEGRGAEASSLIAAIGPHIRLDAFEVGPDVAREIAAAAPDHAVARWDEPRPHIDLSVVVQAQLRSLGLSADSIDDVGGCTMSEPERFFSYRRDGQRSGRHLSAIAG